MHIILLGAQASGKGTQAELLTKELGIPHISSGDLFREEVAHPTTSAGRTIQMYLDRGELVPDELTVALILHRLQEPDCQNGALMDGFPRTLAQAQAFDQGLREHGQQVTTVLYLKVAREELYRRIAGRYICKAHQHIYNIHSSPPKTPGICDLDGSELFQRSDDLGEAVQHRLETFFTQTMHLLDYYGAQEKVFEINGDQAIEAVHQSILACLRKQKAGRAALSNTQSVVHLTR